MASRWLSMIGPQKPDANLKAESSDTPVSSSRFQTVFIHGLTAAVPICLGYIVTGLAFGVLAQKAGLTPLEIGLMSLLVFAGSSQFIAVSMMSAGASPISIILTTFTVNLRHLLMSSSLALYLKKERKSVLALFAYGLTDESFAVNLSRLKHGNWDMERSLVVNHAANLTWLVSTVAGGYGGDFIPAGAFGIDYALIAMFICLLSFQLKSSIYILTALISGVLAVIFSLLIPGNFYIVAASVLGAAIGVWIKAVRKRRTS